MPSAAVLFGALRVKTRAESRDNSPVLQIGRDNRDNLGIIIFLVFP